MMMMMMMVLTHRQHPRAEPGENEHVSVWAMPASNAKGGAARRHILVHQNEIRTQRPPQLPKIALVAPCSPYACKIGKEWGVARLAMLHSTHFSVVFTRDSFAAFLAIACVPQNYNSYPVLICS